MRTLSDHILGQRLRDFRGSKSQQEIADKLGISRSRYSHYENNRVQPDNQLLTKMAELFNTSTDFLLGKTDNPQLDKDAESDSAIKESGNFFFFDKDGLTDEDIEYLKQSVEIMKERARKRAAEKRKDNKK